MNTQYLLNLLLQGDIQSVINNRDNIINLTMYYLSPNIEMNDFMLDDIYNILYISNILYNNTSLNILILEDGIYDLLLELYKRHRNNAPVGALPVNFNIQETEEIVDEQFPEQAIKFFNRDLMFTELKKCTNYSDILPLNQAIYFNQTDISKRVKNVAHEYPKLVGTLDKCKFVMNYQAEEKGVFNDSNVTVLERDFFAKHIKEGYIKPNEVLEMCLQLKYDGISVEHDVLNNTFRSRGDAVNSMGADLTPILKNYPFYNMPAIREPLGIKYEAIMTYQDLVRYNIDRGYNYKNCRTAISGLFSSSDAYKYLDYITLVPLETSIENIDMRTEMEFINKYFTKGIPMIYTIIRGTYQELLFQIKKFVEEAEMMRDFIPFMYDGVVVHYTDPDLRMRLGRENAVNKYSMAIKFNALKKSTIFRGFTYTVGQDGSITPMIHYEPVEFYGTIHDKSTGHSYERFKTLQLKIGDIIDVEYVNDVMPYVSKPWNSMNDSNMNPFEQFPTHCPVCGAELVESKSGKTMLCPNKLCHGRSIARMVNMMQKLDLKDFGEANLMSIGVYSFHELMSLNKSDVLFLGDVMSDKLMTRINELKTKQLYDYQLVGSLGFTNMGRRNWKLIFNVISLHQLISLYSNQLFDDLRHILANIKGIGSVRVDTILDEMEYFISDLIYIMNNCNMIDSLGCNSGKKIRMTGFRNKELIDQLEAMGHDAGEGSVTKDTDILLVPSEGHQSSKVIKATSYGVKVIPVQEFLQNISLYLE